MPKLKPGHISPTPEEEIMINAGIAADEDARELDDEWFAGAKPASEFYPPEIYAALLSIKHSRGRPRAEATKKFTTIRLDADLIDAFKSAGKGWQTRINAALRQYLDEHPMTSPP